MNFLNEPRNCHWSCVCMKLWELMVSTMTSATFGSFSPLSRDQRTNWLWRHEQTVLWWDLWGRELENNWKTESWGPCDGSKVRLVKQEYSEMALWVYGIYEWENSLVVCWMRENDRVISLKAGKKCFNHALHSAELELTPNMKTAPYLYFATDTHCGLIKWSLFHYILELWLLHLSIITIMGWIEVITPNFIIIIFLNIESW